MSWVTNILSIISRAKEILSTPPMPEEPPPGLTMEQFAAQWESAMLLWSLYRFHNAAFCAEYGPDEEPRATWDMGGSFEDGYAAMFPDG